MAQSEIRQPIKIYRGTAVEVFRHRNEIPDDSTVELQIFEEVMTVETEGAFGGKSVLEAFPHLFGYNDPKNLDSCLRWSPVSKSRTRGDHHEDTQNLFC